jgi:uncharacterized protein with von Willebrand factor type A (vWA) domain
VGGQAARGRAERRQGTGGASLGAGGRAALAAWMDDAALVRAVAAWAGRPSPRALAGLRAGAAVEVDVAESVRAAIRRAGALTAITRRPRRRKIPTLLVLWDVSGSMAQYVPHFFPWLYGVRRVRPACRVVAFGRDWADITPWLALPPGAARSRLGELAGVFGGGTAIAATLMAVREAGWLTSGTVLVVISDGWEAEQPEWLAGELAHAAAAVRRLVWVNPLMALPGYQPIQRGVVVARRYADRMAAGMPYDDLARLGEQDA